MPNFITLPANTEGRDFVVGDIHGAFSLLDRVIAQSRFDHGCDRIISVGDLIDRGPNSERALEFLQHPWFLALKGNHEAMFLDMCQDGIVDEAQLKHNIQNGMGWVRDLSRETIRCLEAVFRDLPIAMETDTPRGSAGFVHAEVPRGMDWQTFKQKLMEGDHTTIQHALWSRSRINQPYDNGVPGIDRVFSGHTPLSERPERRSNCYYIDTGAVFSLMPDNEETLALTFADVCGDTRVLEQPFTGDINLIQDVPANGRPFGKYAKS